MESLEAIFKDTKKRMQKGVLSRDQDSQQQIDKIIRAMEDYILNAFPSGRVSYRYQGTLEQALAELRDTANSTNSRPMQEMCDKATRVVANTQKKIEEERAENLPEVERKGEERKAFGKGKEQLGEGRREVNHSSAHSRLEAAVQVAYNKVRSASLADMGLRAPEMFTVEVTVQRVFENNSKLFEQIFDKNIDFVDHLLGKEYDDLEQVVAGNLRREMLKEEQVRLEASAESRNGAPALKSDILSDEPLSGSPWDLRNFGTSREEVQKKTARVSQEARESVDKPKDTPKNKPLETDFII